MKRTVQKYVLLLWSMNNYSFEFIDVKIPDFNSEFFVLWLNEVLSRYGKEPGDIAYYFCSDEKLLSLNNEILNHDFYTDIITLDFVVGDIVSGELYISYDRIIDNAKEFGNGYVFDELCRVMVHGVLHLVGFNDKSEEDQKLMREEETKNLILR
ncbi:MAG: rRNA maturation RNase YbeY [Crocinitomicaceae bacterium]